MTATKGLAPTHGLTLIDVCATLTIACVLFGAAAPAFDRVRDRRTLDGFAGELATDLQFARSEAVARNDGVRMTLKPAAGGGQCIIVHTGSAADCACEPAVGAVCSADVTVLKHHWLPAGDRVAVTANVSSMRFDPVRGMVSPAGTIALTGTDGATIRHVVTPMGRLRSCSVGGRVSGYKAC